MESLNTVHRKWFEGRGISLPTVESMGIYSGQRQQTGDGEFEIVPSPEGELLVFPFYRGGEVVNEKYRGPQKRFFQKLSGVKCFYNADILGSPELQDGTHPLIIVEGELDLLAVKQSGNPFVVSVPDGAPPPLREGVSHESGPIDPEYDTKYEFIHNDWEKLKKIKRIVIATDADEPGKRLAEELVRRLGRSRCSFVTFPEGCKDFNDLIRQIDLEAVEKVVSRAKPYPVSGVYKLEDLPDEPPIVPVSTGFGALDDLIKVFYPSFMVVTGFAGSGKTTWTNQVAANLAALHGWKVAIASFEMRIRPFVTDTLAATYRDLGGRRNEDEWINDNFVFIAPEPGEDNEEFDIDWLIDRAITAVVRYGIRVLVIDPWNEIDHAQGKRESLTEYTGRAIRALKRFAREFEVLVIVVAHPTKSAINKAPEDVGLYDISDSAHFANKADFGVVVARIGEDADCVSKVVVKKIRYQPLTGRKGEVILNYNKDARIFSQ